MPEILTSPVDRLPTHRRDDSLTTVSSITGADILHQHTNLKYFSPCSLCEQDVSVMQKSTVSSNNPTQIKYENCENFNITHNYYNYRNQLSMEG